jgi:hypothetical protein
MQILGCLSDNPSASRVKRRRESGNTDASIPQSQQNYRGALWEQASFSGGPLQRQIAAAKLEPPALMQAYCVPANSWEFNNFVTPQMGSQAQPSYMPSQVDSPPITQNAEPFLLGTNFQPILPGQDAPHLFDPHIQSHSSAEDPAGTTAVDLSASDDLFSVWESAPISFRCVNLILIS